MNFVQSNCSQDYWANPVKAFRSVCVTGPTKKKNDEWPSFMGMTMGRKKKRGSHLFPLRIVHRELFFFRYFHWSTKREPLRRTTCISSLSRLQYILLWLLRDESDNSVECGGGSIHPNIRILVVSFLPIFLQSWGILGASIPEWGIENNACRFNLPVSQKFAQGFRAALLDALSQLARSLAICREAGSR